MAEENVESPVVANGSGSGHSAMLGYGEMAE